MTIFETERLLIALIDPGNEASMKTARRAGRGRHFPHDISRTLLVDCAHLSAGDRPRPDLPPGFPPAARPPFRSH